MIDFNKSNEEILSELLEIITVKTGKLIKFSSIEDQFPGKGYRSLVIKSLDKLSEQDPEVKAVFISASSIGADLSENDNKKIKYIAQIENWPQELTDFILNYCITTKEKWALFGFANKPNLEYIQEQRKQFELQNKKDKLREDYDNIREVWINTYQTMLKWINAKQEAGDPAPELDDIILELRG